MLCLFLIYFYANNTVYNMMFTCYFVDMDISMFY